MHQNRLSILTIFKYPHRGILQVLLKPTLDPFRDLEIKAPGSSKPN